MEAVVWRGAARLGTQEEVAVTAAVVAAVAVVAGRVAEVTEETDVADGTGLACTVASQASSAFLGRVVRFLRQLVTSCHSSSEVSGSGW